MNTMVNTGPAGLREKQALAERNTRADLHCMGDPAEWGWRRPTAAELVAEHLDRLGRQLGEQG